MVPSDIELDKEDVQEVSNESNENSTNIEVDEINAVKPNVAPPLDLPGTSPDPGDTSSDNVDADTLSEADFCEFDCGLMIKVKYSLLRRFRSTQRTCA